MGSSMSGTQLCHGPERPSGLASACTETEQNVTGHISAKKATADTPRECSVLWHLSLNSGTVCLLRMALVLSKTCWVHDLFCCACSCLRCCEALALLHTLLCLRQLPSLCHSQSHNPLLTPLQHICRSINREWWISSSRPHSVS